MVSDGIVAGPVQLNMATKVAIVAMSAIAFYNVLELILLIFATFKRYHGLYFWSLFIASCGCLLHALGFLLKFYQACNNYLAVSIITVGWYTMVTGQSVVLWSRLHLVVISRNTRRFLLYMIIVDAILFHIPTTVLTFGSNTGSPTEELFVHPYSVMEKIQMTVFSIQEFVISGVYVRATLRRLQESFKDQKRVVMQRLIAINVAIIGLDLVLLGIEYASLYDIEVILKSLVYSIKLKLEFAVLGQLVELTRNVAAGWHTQVRIKFPSGIQAPDVR